jgi:hypothetical protein
MHPKIVATHQPEGKSERVSRPMLVSVVRAGMLAIISEVEEQKMARMPELSQKTFALVRVPHGLAAANVKCLALPREVQT